MTDPLPERMLELAERVVALFGHSRRADRLLNELTRIIDCAQDLIVA